MRLDKRLQGSHIRAQIATLERLQPLRGDAEFIADGDTNTFIPEIQT
jgi:hypothetical protein